MKFFNIVLAMALVITLVSCDSYLNKGVSGPYVTYFNPLALYSSSNLTQLESGSCWEHWSFIYKPEEITVSNAYFQRYGLLSNTNYVGLFNTNHLCEVVGHTTNLITHLALSLNYTNQTNLIYFGTANKRYYTLLRWKKANHPVIEVYNLSNESITDLIAEPIADPYEEAMQMLYNRNDRNEILGNDLVVALGRGESDLLAYCKNWYGEYKQGGDLYLVNLSNDQGTLISSNAIDVVGFSPKNRYLFYTTSSPKRSLYSSVGGPPRHLGQAAIYDTILKTNYVLANYSILSNITCASPGDGVYAFDPSLKSVYLWVEVIGVLPFYQELELGSSVSNIVGLWQLDISSLGLSE